jgi:DNA recombination protein RmuC
MEFPTLILVVVAFLALATGLAVGFLIGRMNTNRALELEEQLASDRLSNIRDAFSGLAAEALRRNSQGFIELANQVFARHQLGAAHDLEKRQKAIDELVKPVKETLDRFELNVRELEKVRVGAYESLTSQVKTLFESQQGLRSETGRLVAALRAPHVRGRWGEIQLRRVVELAGMINHCDFVEQQTITTDDTRLRPDMVVKLPGAKIIVVDAKTPLVRYLSAMEATDDTSRQVHLAEYAVQVRGHITALSSKSYWEQFPSAPEFVFMFLPGESFFSAALEVDPSLIEMGAAQRVIVATPTTLIALLKAVSYGWRQERLARDAEKIGYLGKELYERICKMSEHFVSLGRSLRSAVDRYNDTLGTLEGRVLVSARRFKEMPIAATDKDVEEATQIDATTRKLQSPELAEGEERSIVLAHGSQSEIGGVSHPSGPTQ